MVKWGRRKPSPFCQKGVPDMRRLIPLILALLLMSGDGRFKCWYSSWYEHPEIDWLNLTGGSFTEAEA